MMLKKLNPNGVEDKDLGFRLQITSPYKLCYYEKDNVLTVPIEPLYGGDVISVSLSQIVKWDLESGGKIIDASKKKLITENIKKSLKILDLNCNYD